MIISAKANGDILNIKPEVFYQGSTEANKIYLIAPLVANSSVSIGFTLPNTTDIPVTLMTLSSAISDTLNTWVYEVPVALTQYVGIVKVNISVTTPTGKVITLKRCQFEVKRGDEVILPDEPEEDVYQRIVQALSQISAELINKVDISYADGTTSQSISNNSNGLKLTKTVDGVTVTVEVTENGLEINGVDITANVNEKISEHNASDTAHGDIRTMASTAEINSANALVKAENAESVAGGIDGKATLALSNSEHALENATDAKDIALGKTNNKSFDTLLDMQAFIGDEANKGKFVVGSEFLIKEDGVPDYWVTEILDEPNLDGYYYELEETESSVHSVNGQRGAVVLKTDDISDEEQLNKFVTNEEKTQIANAVPNTRTVNSKVLSDDIILNSDDISDTDKTNKWTDATEKEKVSKIVINGDGSKALLNDGTYGEVGTVDTVNGVLPDVDKNITIDADDISDDDTDNKFVTIAEKEYWNDKTDIEYLNEYNNQENTRILIKATADVPFNLYLSNNPPNNIVIYWGNLDREDIEWGVQIDKTIQHTYSQDGFYWIIIKSLNGIGGMPNLRVNNQADKSLYYKLYIADYKNTTYSSGDYTVYGCNYLDEVKLPQGLAYISSHAFEESGVRIIDVSQACSSIGDYAFSNCYNLKQITLGRNLDHIGDYAFYGCSNLFDITLPNFTLSTIGDFAFSHCINISKLIIPNTVTSIGSNFVSDCTMLKDIIFLAEVPPTITNTTFINRPYSEYSIYVPASSLDAYKTAENWSAFADIIFAIPDGELIQELSDKLDTIEEGAEVNVIETVKVNGTALTPTLKVVDITVPVDAGDVGALPDTTKYGATIDLTYTALTGELEVTLKDQDGAELSSDNVDLPMELIIESGTVETCTVDDEPVVGYVVGDKYIDLVLANESHIYILVSELIDQITIEETGDGNAVTDISVNGNVITETKGKTFVEAVAGKGLSTNDYDATEKEKVSKIVINGDGSKALLNDGTYGEVGTVDTVNGVLPDENKNITIDADDISDTSTINKFATAEELAQIATNTGDITDLESNKADKVSGATDGNIAELDSSGNLKDSGVDISDFVTISDIVNDLTTGGTDVPLSAEQGKVLNTNKEDIANKNVNNGYCPLDSGGKVPLANLPSSLLKYQGVWNASTNTPTLTNPDLTKIGYVYNVSVAGTQFDIDFSLGDWLIYNASGIPEKSDNSDDVVSVNGQTGAVVLNTSHISATTDKNYVTDAEKTKLGNVLEKTTTGDTRRVYGINSSNEQELTEIEETPTASSAKLVTSGGVKTALDNKATKLSIGQWNVPYRDEAGSGEPNTSRLATMTSPLPSAILIRDADGKATFVGGTSASQGIVKSQLDSAVENMVTTNTEQTITGVKTFNAPTNIAGTEQATTKFKTSNGGSVTIGKEGPNSGTMLRFDQVDGTERLKFRGSATAGAMVWSQPEANAGLYMDLADSGGVTKRITFNALQIKHPVKISSPIIQGTTFTNGTNTYTPPSSTGTLALTSDIPTTETTNSGTGTVSQTLTPNVYYKFTGAPTTLTLTLGTAVSGKMNEYMFQFVANSSGTTLTAISGVTWVGGTPTITANKTYQASIVNGIGVIVEA